MCEPGAEEEMPVPCIRREPAAVMEKWRGRIAAIMAAMYEKKKKKYSREPSGET